MTSDSNSILRIRLAARISDFPTYKLLSEWLDIYTYILPAARQTYIPPVPQITTASDIFSIYLRVKNLESTLTLQEQIACQTLISTGELKT